MPFKDKSKRVGAQKRYRQRQQLKSFTLEDGTKVIPMRYRCVECNEIYEQGYVHADFYPIQEGWLCPKCQETLPHTTVTDKTEHTKLVKIDYSPKIYKVVTGECDLCKCFPCEHVHQVAHAYQDLIQTPLKTRYEWELVKEVKE
jgi:hypothetical protein